MEFEGFAERGLRVTMNVGGDFDDDDAAFLANTEIIFFIRHLFSQVAALRPEDSIDYAAKFFKRILSCHHVLGADYTYITSTKHNRRAFIFCLIEIFHTFPFDEAMSTAEYVIFTKHLLSCMLIYIVFALILNLFL